MIPKSYAQPLILADIEALCAAGAAESRTLEYKEDFPAPGDRDMVPFIAGLAAFANTLGGDMVVGVRAVDGVPVEITGVEIENLDREKQRLEQAIRASLEPRLNRFDIQAIECAERRYVIIVRVPRSWAAPHKVTKNEKFYARSTAGKYPMDVTELRGAFLSSAEIPARIQRFRTSRVAAVLANDELPALLAPGGKMILHLIPIGAFTQPAGQAGLSLDNLGEWPHPMGARAWTHRLNMDGIVRYATLPGGNLSVAYSQMHRDGILESVVSLPPREGEGLILPSLWYEQQVLHACRTYQSWAATAGVGFPVYALLSLVDMKGSILGVDRGMFIERSETLGRDPALFPETILDDPQSEPATAMRTVFDMVWNAYGFPRSFNYDDEGNWVGR